ncbi:MAG: hypothetical protein ACJLS3_07095, partial [Erythrobacter sp.]
FEFECSAALARDPGDFRHTGAGQRQLDRAPALAVPRRPGARGACQPACTRSNSAPIGGI